MNSIKSFDLTTPGIVVDHECADHYQLLPPGSAILHGMATSGIVDFTAWEKQILQLPTGYRFFIDNSYDPVKLSDRDIQSLIELITTYFPGSDPVFLSSKCGHYLCPVDNIVYFPFFFFYVYENSYQRPRQKRIGCLNRQNSPHRVWLMHRLLTDNLLDADRDVYSICFSSPYDDTSYADVDAWLNQEIKINSVIRSYSPRIATHDDNFPNDVTTVNHPAWHTAITIVTETEPGPSTLITEKTLKAIAAECCWTAYMDDAGYRLLEEFGFDPRFFAHHAEDKNIDPLIEICRMFDTESVAADYRDRHMDQIIHNRYCLGAESTNLKKSYQWTVHLDNPWFSRWFPKFQHSIS
jgi:hypothetical protein